MNQHIHCLTTACDLLKINYREIDKSGVFLEIIIGDKSYYFIANEMPFNQQIVSRIVTDKGYTYDLLHDVVRMPKTVSYLDPDCEELFVPYLSLKTNKEIVESIVSQFKFPVIVKKNSGSQGVNVFRCINQADILDATKQIFDQSSINYDHILLAQEHVNICREFRVTVFQKKVILIYEKDFSQAKYVGNLSPLHWEGSKAVIISDPDLQTKIGKFVEPIFNKLSLEYGGMDIALDQQNELHLFEINSKPAYNYLIENNGVKPLVNVYVQMLTYLTENS